MDRNSIIKDDYVDLMNIPRSQTVKSLVEARYDRAQSATKTGNTT